MKTHNLLQSFGFAWAGLKASWHSERNFRIHLCALACIATLLVAVRPNPIWWALLLVVSGCVIAAELINTALEKLIDHLHPQQHTVIKTVKDTLAGAVLLMAITALVVFVIFVSVEFLSL